MNNTLTLSFNKADLLLEALTIWAWGENGVNNGDEVEFGTEDQLQLNNEQIQSLFDRIQAAKFSKA